MPSLLPFPLSLWTGEGEGEGATSVRHPGLDPEFVSEWLRATVIVPLPANAPTEGLKTRRVWPRREKSRP